VNLVSSHVNKKRDVLLFGSYPSTDIHKIKDKTSVEIEIEEKLT
jgi:hypothetical protein